MRRQVVAWGLALVCLLSGCARRTDAAFPDDCPRTMTAVLYAADDPDTPQHTERVTYTYQTDADGRVTARHYTLSGVVYREQTVYDEAGHVRRVVSDRLSDDRPAAGSTAHTYTYDEAGRRLTDTLYTREGTGETPVSCTTYTYGDDARAQGAVVSGMDGTVRATVTFTYTPADADAPPLAEAAGDWSRAALTEEMMVTTAAGEVTRTWCIYDAADRPLYRCTEGAASEEVYTYDEAGRLLTHTAYQADTICHEWYTYT